MQPNVADVLLEDDRLIEVSWNGDIVWEWLASDHIDELGFAPDARKAIKAARSFNKARGSFDWLHINSATYVGPNHWFDQGDKRFAPNNVIISSREASLLAIVGRDGSIVWRLGPDFSQSRELRAIRQIIGQHHAHLIPKGLPGAGNLLVFDNGGSSGYGFANPIAPDGTGRVCARHVARARDQPRDARAGLVLHESQVLQHQHQQRAAAAERQHADHRRRRRADVRGHQRGHDRLGVHVSAFSGANASNAVYRAYRVPYAGYRSYVPTERRITPPALGDFRVPVTWRSGSRSRLPRSDYLCCRQDVRPARAAG